MILYSFSTLIQYANQVYDWSLTIDDEVTHAWPAPWSVTKILFFLTRYLPCIDRIIDVYCARNSSQSQCLLLIFELSDHFGPSPSIPTCNTLYAVGGCES